LFEQDLSWKQWEKRQEYRCGRHARHVPEVGACRGENVFQRIRKCPAPFLDATSYHIQMLLEQHEIGRLLRDIRCVLDR
jgi:hypothetical protein